MINETLESYLASIARHAPTLVIDSARLNQDGMANDVVIVNEALVFRFSKTADAKGQVEPEIRLLELVRQHVTLATPVVEEQTEEYVLYRLLDGRPLYRHELLRWDEPAQQRCLEDLAIFLQELHAIPLEDVPLTPWAQTQLEGRHQRYLAKLAEIETVIFPLLWADQKAWVYDLFAPLQSGALDLDAYRPVFIHRDLASYHILYDP
ncbi:MAG: phosphotransferase, partial [Caldilineaceae bacterium]|nr:phosphotransferase [Caldilineaceae bacterium]